MASFRVTLPENGATTEYTFTAVVSTSHGPSPCEFRGSKLLYDGNSTVYRGTLYVEGDVTRKTVCKIARGGHDARRLKREAELYTDDNHLRTLQGRCVPRFFGYYECFYVSKEGECKTRMGCMILEDCGRLLSGVEVCNNDNLKLEIVCAMLQIHHAAHLEHGDFNWTQFRHVLIDEDKEIRIIDFDHARNHECEHSSDIVLWAYMPPAYEFGCRELYDTCTLLAVWTPIEIRIMAHRLHIFRFCTFERLIKWAIHKYPYLRVTFLEDKARKALNAYSSYDTWSYRFGAIGHPTQHRMPLEIPGLEEDNEEPGPPLSNLERKPVIDAASYIVKV